MRKKPAWPSPQIGRTVSANSYWIHPDAIFIAQQLDLLKAWGRAKYAKGGEGVSEALKTD
jgi:hypothetical protein